MNDIIEKIQSDILDAKVSLNSVLLKAKVLAYQLKNDEFKKWIKNEVDGYQNRNEVPDYRIKHAQSLGHFVSRFQEATNIPIPTSALPEWLREEASTIWIHEGVRAVEEIANSGNGIISNWPAEWLSVLNRQNMTDLSSLECVQAKRIIPSYIYAQILDTVRSRLQDFILEISDLPWNMGKELPPSDKIRQIVDVTIFNSPQGGNMSVFDQRGQNVNYQYNAAGDINFGAVESRMELVHELEKLKAELNKAATAQVIDVELVTDAEYQITKAVQQAQKPEPDKKEILDHLETAKAAIEGVTAAGGMVTALIQAAELVSKLF